MSRTTRLAICSLAAATSLLLAGSSHAATATVSATVIDAEGKPFADALILFALVDDPGRSFTLGQNDAGAYADAVDVPQGESSWRITRVVATGFLPMQISVTARSSGAVVQEIAPMELNPGIAIPEIKLVGGGTTEIRLTLGERAVVMERFAATREQPDEEEAAPAEVEDTTFNRALRAYGAGDLDGAVGLFERAIAEEPQNAEMRVTYAKVLYQAKRHEAFERAARGALEIDPANGELMMMVYSSARGRGDMKAALEALLAVKAAGQGGADLRQHLDYVAKKMGPSPDAIPAWTAILELDPKSVEACTNLAALYSTRGDAKRSDEYLSRAVALDPSGAPTIHLDLATKLLAPQNVPAAQLDRGIALLRRAIEADPALVPAYRKLGLALWKKEDWAGTRQALQKYLQLSPEAEDRDTILDYLSRLPE